MNEWMNGVVKIMSTVLKILMLIFSVGKCVMPPSFNNRFIMTVCYHYHQIIYLIPILQINVEFQEVSPNDAIPETDLFFYISEYYNEYCHKTVLTVLYEKVNLSPINLSPISSHLHQLQVENSMNPDIFSLFLKHKLLFV